jgi:Fe2+ transport system protein B
MKNIIAKICFNQASCGVRIQIIVIFIRVFFLKRNRIDLNRKYGFE